MIYVWDTALLTTCVLGRVLYWIFLFHIRSASGNVGAGRRNLSIFGSLQREGLLVEKKVNRVLLTMKRG